MGTPAPVGILSRTGGPERHVAATVMYQLEYMPGDLGLEPVLGEHALARDGYMAGRPAQRASDINRMFADPAIGAVLASHGGHVAHGVLRHLD